MAKAEPKDQSRGESGHGVAAYSRTSANLGIQFSQSCVYKLKELDHRFLRVLKLLRNFAQMKETEEMVFCFSPPCSLFFIL